MSVLVSNREPDQTPIDFTHSTRDPLAKAKGTQGQSAVPVSLWTPFPRPFVTAQMDRPGLHALDSATPLTLLLRPPYFAYTDQLLRFKQQPWRTIQHGSPPLAACSANFTIVP